MQEVKTPLLKSLQVAAVCGVVLAANPSDAAIIGGNVEIQTNSNEIYTPNITVINPPLDEPFEVGRDVIEGLDLFALEEKQNITLAQSLNIFSGYHYSSPRPTADVFLPENSLVSSYLLWVDPVGQGFIGGNGRRYVWDGYIEFDQPVLGIIPRDIIINPTTSSTNNLFGLDNVNYSLGQSLDNVVDIVTINGNVLNFTLSAGDGTDHFRVITAGTPVNSVPEPLTILGTGAALGFGMLFRKMKQQ